MRAHCTGPNELKQLTSTAELSVTSLESGENDEGETDKPLASPCGAFLVFCCHSEEM